MFTISPHLVCSTTKIKERILDNISTVLNCNEGLSERTTEVTIADDVIIKMPGRQKPDIMFLPFQRVERFCCNNV